MDKIIDYFINNPSAITVILVIIGIVVIVLLIIIVIAAIQGREVTIWPPKIGAIVDKKNKSDLSTEHKDMRSDNTIAIDGQAFGLYNRVEFRETFSKRLENAREVWLLGINIDGILSQYDGFIISKAESGCKFKILITDPLFFENDDLVITAWPAGSKSRKDLSHSLGIIDKIVNKVGNVNFSVAFTPFPPPYTLLAINPNETISDIRSEIQVEIYSFQPYSHARPHFILIKRESPQWFNYFKDEFDLAWKASRKYDPQKGLKEIKEKAGVIVFRKEKDHSPEFLVISSRFNPNSWVFPGGEIEPSETAEKAAMRECKEESGYIIKIHEKIGTLEIDKLNTFDKTTFYLGSVQSETNEYEKYRRRLWLNQEELRCKIVEDFLPVAINAIEMVDRLKE